MKKKIYSVLFEYSPNGRVDRGEFSSEIADGKFFGTREAACLFIKAKYDSLLLKEREEAGHADAEWAEAVSDEDMKAFGYSWTDDFSSLGFERESSYPDVPAEPKFSWRVIELEGEI